MRYVKVEPISKELKFKIKKTAKTFKNRNNQSVTLTKSSLKEDGLYVGNNVNYCVDDKNRIIITNVDKSFKNRWSDFLNNDEIYADKETDWGKSAGRGLW